MNTLGLDNENNLIVGSDFVLKSEKEAIIQDCKTRLKMFSGEYPFDTGEGIDYIGLLRGNNREAIKKALQKELKKDNRLEYVTIAKLNLTGSKMEISVECTLYNGEIINV